MTTNHRGNVRSKTLGDTQPSLGQSVTHATTKQTGASCNGCGTHWTGLSRAHCSACHQTFASSGLFDRHRSSSGDHGTCLNPASIIHTATGERVMFYREGMWRGPEMTEEQKIKAGW